LKCHTVQAAIGKLQEELIHFFEVFEKNTSLTSLNPFFGVLNFEENIQLLHKHALHHLKQFGVEPFNV
jgi:predicted DNA-binding protein with PD1-like motif